MIAYIDGYRCSSLFGNVKYPISALNLSVIMPVDSTGIITNSVEPVRFLLTYLFLIFSSRKTVKKD